MSATPQAHGAHGAHGHEGGHGADHHPHVLPLILYFKTYGALLFLTALTVGVSYVHLGTTLNLIVAMLVATVKATTVAAIFMHLFWDQKFFSVIFGSSLVFLAIFLAFTMFDTEARGMADPYEMNKPANYKQPFAGTMEDARIKAEAEKQRKAADAALKKPEAPAAPGGAAPAPGGAAPAGGTAPAGGAAPAPGGATLNPVAPAGAAPAPAGAAPAGAAPGTPPVVAPAPGIGAKPANP